MLKIILLAGAVALGAGAGLWWLGNRESQSAVGVAITAERAEVSFSCGF